MDWNTLFPAAHQPSFKEIENYVNNPLWKNIFDYMETAYKAKPKMTYSTCSGKPGWNVKFQKSGQAFGTLYPESGFFSVFMVVAYRLMDGLEAVLPELSPRMQEVFKGGDDFMKNGKYYMFEIENEADLEGYKKVCAVKLKPKYI